jgi:hypothetical protein
MLRELSDLLEMGVNTVDRIVEVDGVAANWESAIRTEVRGHGCSWSKPPVPEDLE